MNKAMNKDTLFSKVVLIIYLFIILYLLTLEDINLYIKIILVISFFVFAYVDVHLNYVLHSSEEGFDIDLTKCVENEECKKSMTPKQKEIIKLN